MKRHGVAVCLWRQVVAFGLMVFLASGGVSQAVESQAVQAEGDPVAMEEAEGWLKLDMRQDGADFFIYPSFFDAKNYTQMVQYKAIEKQSGIIADVMVEVLDPDGNVDWSSENLGTAADWKDSDFEGRTNYTRAANNSQDAGGQPNKVEDLFKFVDPGGSGQATFTARLTVTLTTGKRLINTVPLPFQARTRVVAIVNQAKEPPDQENWGFGPYGKAWIWMTYGLTEGGTAECVNPAEDGDKLILDYSEKNFGFAYECTTPRSVRLRSIHHGSADGQIRLPNWYRGFNWGGGVEGFLDVAGFAHSHHCTVDFLHCHSAHAGGGAAKSLADALTGKVGGGNTTVIGYDQTISFKPGLSGPEYGAIGTTPELPEDEYLYFCERFDARIKESLVNQGVCMPDNENKMHPWWIADKTIATVVSAVSLNQNAIINAAKADFREHFGKEPTFDFEVTLAEPLSYYYTDSGESGPRLYHRNADETEEPVTPSPFTAP